MSTVPSFLADLVDDAALFPPASIPLPEAVAAHREHRASSYAAMVGPFVISDIKLPDLLEVLEDSTEALAVSVVVTGGAGAIEPAVRWATRSGLLDVRALETPLRNEDDLARNASRVVTAIDHVREDLGDIPVYVEPPRIPDGPSHQWLAALDEIASAGLRLKFRTGGVDLDAFPSATELAAGIDAALDRELPFKCTAGLHHAVRTDHQHGFLNILAATAAAFDGAPRGDVIAELETSDIKIQTDGFDTARRWFTSFGCCAVEDPLEDLIELGLLQP
ncbi:MAG TPA: hypothetical protein VLI04_04220 [Nocardioidaceae bacterium]|nr:hypothetical protein [Nocardioidaceae bacterium]